MKEYWYSVIKGAPQAAPRDEEDFQGSRFATASTRVLQGSAFLLTSSPGKGDLRRLNHVVPIFKGKLQNDSGSYTVISLISVQDKAKEKLIQSSPDKEELQGKHSAEQCGCGQHRL